MSSKGFDWASAYSRFVEVCCLAVIALMAYNNSADGWSLWPVVLFGLVISRRGQASKLSEQAGQAVAILRGGRARQMSIDDHE